MMFGGMAWHGCMWLWAWCLHFYAEEQRKDEDRRMWAAYEDEQRRQEQG